MWSFDLIQSLDNVLVADHTGRGDKTRDTNHTTTGGINPRYKTTIMRILFRTGDWEVMTMVSVKQTIVDAVEQQQSWMYVYTAAEYSTIHPLLAVSYDCWTLI